MTNFVQINSISELHNLVGLPKPLHPLITIIRKWPHIDFDHNNMKFTAGLYILSMKGKFKNPTFQYGRKLHDFEEGTIVFLAPNQVISFLDAVEEIDDTGWTILFHPDLIRKSDLGKKMKDYSYFDYDHSEALHVSDAEKKMLIQFVEHIDRELRQNVDKHSRKLIISNLETILNYSLRYYERQFYMRTDQNKDIIAAFEKFLRTYFESDSIRTEGLPTLAKCGQALNLSGSYLSDLLKLETGRSAKDHIHSFIIEEAKILLLGSNTSINEISYGLGFEYPQNFSKLFKSKTGNSPSEYRNIN